MVSTTRTDEHSHSSDIEISEASLGFPKRITTSTDSGRAWFARGWLHVLNFNHEAALASFRTCTEVDPLCAMAYWGVALAGSSNYNFPPGHANNFDAIQRALTMVRDEKGLDYAELERDLIQAMATRSSLESKDDIDPAQFSFGNTPELNRTYAEAMAEVNKKYPDDVDVVALYAESLMVLNPWNMWIKKPGPSGGIEVLPADNNTLIAKDILENVMKLPGGMEHPAILHMYCHLMELSDDPVSAMPAADVLRVKFPHSGHLIHMASHIDIWAGHYKAALDTNIAAIAADRGTVEYTGMDDCLYKSYRIHNFHMAIWAAMLTGQAEVAMEGARDLDGMLPPGDETSGVQYLLDGFAMGSAWEAYTLVKWHAMIRFGLWDEILAEPLNENPTLYPTALTTGHYARGIAFASKGMIAEAEEEQATYLERMKDPAFEGLKIHNNFLMSDDSPCLFKVGEAMLAGEIEYRKGNFDNAFELLREAVRLDVGLAYDEPWGWMVPSRHALGALLLEQGHVEEATQVFRDDLKMYPDNMWGLLGLRQCLDKAGKGSDVEAIEVNKRYREASSLATIKPPSTCFCAKAAGAAPPTT